MFNISENFFISCCLVDRICGQYRKNLFDLSIILSNHLQMNNNLTQRQPIIYASSRFSRKNSRIGDVAQLGERDVRNVEARGSIPLISTKT